jgi:hypothetical protein
MEEEEAEESAWIQMNLNPVGRRRRDRRYSRVSLRRCADRQPTNPFTFFIYLSIIEGSNLWRSFGHEYGQNKVHANG